MHHVYEREIEGTCVERRNRIHASADQSFTPELWKPTGDQSHRGQSKYRSRLEITKRTTEIITSPDWKHSIQRNYIDLISLNWKTSQTTRTYPEQDHDQRNPPTLKHTHSLPKLHPSESVNRLESRSHPKHQRPSTKRQNLHTDRKLYPSESVNRPSESVNRPESRSHPQHQATKHKETEPSHRSRKSGEADDTLKKKDLIRS